MRGEPGCRSCSAEPGGSSAATAGVAAGGGDILERWRARRQQLQQAGGGGSRFDYASLLQLQPEAAADTPIGTAIGRDGPSSSSNSALPALVGSEPQAAEQPAAAAAAVGSGEVTPEGAGERLARLSVMLQQRPQAACIEGGAAAAAEWQPLPVDHSRAVEPLPAAELDAGASRSSTA